MYVCTHVFSPWQDRNSRFTWTQRQARIAVFGISHPQNLEASRLFHCSSRWSAGVSVYAFSNLANAKFRQDNMDDRYSHLRVSRHNARSKARARLLSRSGLLITTWSSMAFTMCSPCSSCPTWDFFHASPGPDCNCVILGIVVNITNCIIAITIFCSGGTDATNKERQ